MENGRATGVECAGGETFHADIVISNAGIKRTVEMAGEGLPGRVRRLRQGPEVFLLLHHQEVRPLRIAPWTSRFPCIFNTPYVNADHMFDYIDEGGVPEDPLLFVPVPSEWDEHSPPPGKQLVIMGVPGPIEVNTRTIAQSEAILKVGEKRLFEMYPEDVLGHRVGS